MKAGVVVYIDSDPANPVAIFFNQAFPGGKTAAQAAASFASTLSGTSGAVPSDSKPAELSQYTLVNDQVISL
jgi:hypothetical protein